MLHLKNVEVVFNRGLPIENRALSDFSLLVESGEFVTIIGGNGAGKSTLLNLVAGNIFASKGKIIMDGIDVTQLPVHKRAKYVARVFQDPLLGSCSSLTLEENLAIAQLRGRKHGWGMSITTSERRLYQALLAELGMGLENRLKDKMDQLSGGQRQAVSLLMASVQPCKVLLLDEHTAALDPKIARLVLSLTDQIVAKHDLTVLMITHSMSEALAHGNRTLVLQQGKIVQDLSGSARKNLTPKDLLLNFEA